MERLKARLLELVAELDQLTSSDILQRLDDLVSVYPFNEYEFLISSLMGYEKISLDDYHELREEYLARNIFLYVFEISAPKGINALGIVTHHHDILLNASGFKLDDWVCDMKRSENQLVAYGLGNTGTTP